MNEMKEEMYRMVQHGKIVKLDRLEGIDLEDREKYLFIGVGGTGANTVVLLNKKGLLEPHIQMASLSYEILQGADSS